jgi:GxxExxY protein
MQAQTRPEDLTEAVTGLAMKVHRALWPGFVEFVYRNTLLVELRKSNLAVEVEKPLKVIYEGIMVGEFSADLVINGWLLVELKAVSQVTKDHEVQVVNYLTALNQPFGLLLNFGSHSLQYKRKYQRAPSHTPPDLIV